MKSIIRSFLTTLTWITVTLLPEPESFLAINIFISFLKDVLPLGPSLKQEKWNVNSSKDRHKPVFLGTLQVQH